MADNVVGQRTQEIVEVAPEDVFIPSGRVDLAPGAAPGTEEEVEVAQEVVREITLEPEEYSQSDYTSIPSYTITKRSLIVDIETTGVQPYESRIIAIGFLDPSQENPEVSIFVEEDEETLVQKFVDFWEGSTYTDFVGYNAPFDYRFLFAACARYRISAPRLFDASVYDLQDVYDKVRPGQVFGRNKSGTLDDWSQYLLGFGKDTSAAEVIQAWKDGKIDIVVQHVQTDVIIEYALFLLDKLAKGQLNVVATAIQGSGTTFSSQSPAVAMEDGAVDTPVKVYCSICAQEHMQTAKGKEFKCTVCGGTSASTYMPR